MAFTEASAGGNFNSTTAVTVLQGASLRRIIKSVLIHNRDTVTHQVRLYVTISSVDYTIFNVYLSAGDTMVLDIPVVLTGTTQYLKGVLAAAITTNQPQFVVTYATVT